MPTFAPEISSAELHSFYNAHFGHEATAHFQTGFLVPTGQDGGGDELQDEDDGLGYYADGVKRTLTDEQIAIFRHSEIEALRREQERVADAKKSNDADKTEKGSVTASQLDSTKSIPTSQTISTKAMSTKTISTNQPNTAKPDPIQQTMASNSDTGGGQQRKKKAKREPKPDLRKRTWDVVDKGLDSLNYDDM